VRGGWSFNSGFRYATVDDKGANSVDPDVSGEVLRSFAVRREVPTGGFDDGTRIFRAQADESFDPITPVSLEDGGFKEVPLGT
jgi:hypothetical protein